MNAQDDRTASTSELSQSQYKQKEHDPEYKGQQFDQELKNGPMTSRGCTNCFCLIIFCLFWAACIIIAIYAYKSGDPNRLAAPYDSDGKQCGYDLGFESFKYIYFVSPYPNYTDRYACVSECPKYEGDKKTLPKSLSCQGNSQVFETNSKGCLETPSSDLSKSILIYDTVRVIKTCVPTDSKLFDNIYGESNPGDEIQQYLEDLKISWPVLLGSVFIALTLGYIYLILMRNCAGCMVWSCILIYIGFLIGGGIYMYSRAENKGPFAQNGDENQAQELKIMAAAFFIVAAISIIWLFCSCTRIKLAIAIIKCSAQYSRSVLSSFLVPMFFFVIYVLFLVFWIYSVLYIYSSGDVTQDAKTPYTHIQWDKGVKRCLTVFFISLLWNGQFLASMSYFINASGACLWYFSHGFENKLGSPISKSFFRSLLHLGSFALGSGIITIIWLINFYLKLIHNATKARRAVLAQHGEPEVQNCYDYFCRCCIYYAECFEEFMRYITHHAYIQIALTGRDFMKAAHDSYYLMSRNANRFASLSGIGSVLIILGKMFICVSTSFFSYLILTNLEPYKTEMKSPLFPLIFIIITSYVIGSMFMSVYGTAADAILQCYCIDEELHAYLGVGPQYAPPILKEFFENNKS